MAAARLVDELARAHWRYAIAVIGDEPRLCLYRVLLSSCSPARPDSMYRAQAADWWPSAVLLVKYGCAVTVDVGRRDSDRQ